MNIKRLKPTGEDVGICLTLNISLMNYLSHTNFGSIKICEEDTCIEAKGVYATQITNAITSAIILTAVFSTGIALYKAFNS